MLDVWYLMVGAWYLVFGLMVVLVVVLTVMVRTGLRCISRTDLGKLKQGRESEYKESDQSVLTTKKLIAFSLLS